MKKIVSIALIVLFIGLIGTAITVSSTDVFTLETVPMNDEYEVNGDMIKNVEVDVSSTDVVVSPSKNDVIYVKLAGELSERIKDNYKLVVKEQGDTLKIAVDNKDMFFNIGVAISRLTLEVQVPETMYDSFSVESSSGDINIVGILGIDLSTEASSGDITVEGITSDSHYNLEASSGSITVKNAKAPVFNLIASSGDITLENAIGDIEVQTSSGSIEINNQVLAGHINAEASSGDVDVTFVDLPDSLFIDFKGSSGDGEINLEGVSYEEKSEDRIIGTIGKGDYQLFVRTSSGDFQLK